MCIYGTVQKYVQSNTEKFYLDESVWNTFYIFQRNLQMAMLNVGQFEHALNELLAWLDKTDETVDDISSTFGDPKQIEIELAKLKVTMLC